jgi:hypothetical protein
VQKLPVHRLVVKFEQLMPNAVNLGSLLQKAVFVPGLTCPALQPRRHDCRSIDAFSRSSHAALSSLAYGLSFRGHSMAPRARRRSSFALDKTANYYVVAYTKIGPT